MQRDGWFHSEAGSPAGLARKHSHSLEAAAVFPENTDAARDDDVARRGRGHSSSFTSSVA